MKRPRLYDCRSSGLPQAIGLCATDFTSIAAAVNEVRKRSLQGLEFLGVEMDTGLNGVKSSEERFIDKGSRVRAMVIPTNEELVIARDTLEFIK